MKIGLVTIAYTPGGYTTKQLDSILPYSKHNITTYLYLHNGRSQELIEECEKLTEKYYIEYYPFGFNRGISLAANEVIHDTFDIKNRDILIGVGQDIFFNSPTAFDNWIEKAKPYIDTYCYIGSKTKEEDTAPHGACITTPLCWKTMGCIDENFFPAQYEEIDSQRRLSFLFRDKPFKIDIVTDSTHDSMLSRRNDMSLNIQQNYITYPLCRSYYIDKWGGDIGSEQYIHPFNDESIGYYIPWENHSNPYGKYDRQDQGIVRI